MAVIDRIIIRHLALIYLGPRENLWYSVGPPSFLTLYNTLGAYKPRADRLVAYVAFRAMRHAEWMNEYNTLEWNAFSFDSIVL